MAFATAFLLCICLLLAACFNNESFNSERWIRGDIRVRGRMVRDLRSTRLLEGKTEAEIISLLGEPDYRSELRPAWVYKVDIGHKFGSGPWTYDLFVLIDPFSKRVKHIALDD